MTTNDCSSMLIPIDKVAQELGTTALNVLMQIKRGHLAGEEVDGVWYVTAASLSRLDPGTREPVVAMACQGHCRNCGSH